MSTAALFLKASIAELERYKTLAEKALAQVSDEDWFYVPAQGSNGLAHIVKHIAGNLRSRWADFLSTDGEKPDRHRDSEFELATTDTVEQLHQSWDAAWKIVFDSLNNLSEADLAATVTIRNQPHSVPEAIQRSVAHVAYHTGQIVQLAKIIKAEQFENLSVPKGKSEEFLEAMRKKFGGSASR